MFLKKRIVIADNERGLLFRDRQLISILDAGVHAVFDAFGRIKVSVFDITEPEVKQSQIKMLFRTKTELCNEYFMEIITSENEVAMIYIDGKFKDLMSPQTDKVFWKVASKIEVRKINITENIQVTGKDLKILAKAAKVSVFSKGLMIQEIINKQVGLLFIDGEFIKTLSAGKYGFWSYTSSVAVEVVETRTQNIDVSGQEILTKDKVSLRVNLSASFKVTNAQKAVTELFNYKEFLYNELQLALRKAIGTQTLDALLADKEAIDSYVRSQVIKRVVEFGLNLLDVGVKDIILPGEMKTILNKVVEAEKEAKANVIKRREETAATRSLLNTAKLMDDSPTLKRLKELETLEKIADKVESLTVFGGMDSMVKDTIKINV